MGHAGGVLIDVFVLSSHWLLTGRMDSFFKEKDGGKNFLFAIGMRKM